MIDDKARLFGKINIIDLLIIIGIAALLGFGVFQMIRNRYVPEERPDPILHHVVMTVDQIANFNADNIQLGVLLIDNARNVPFGEIIALDRQGSINWTWDMHGNVVRSTAEGFSSVTITTELYALPNEHGIVIAGRRYAIGEAVMLRVGPSHISMRIIGFEEVA